MLPLVSILIDNENSYIKQGIDGFAHKPVYRIFIIWLKKPTIFSKKYPQRQEIPKHWFGKNMLIYGLLQTSQ